MQHEAFTKDCEEKKFIGSALDAAWGKQSMSVHGLKQKVVRYFIERRSQYTRALREEFLKLLGVGKKPEPNGLAR